MVGEVSLTAFNDCYIRTFAIPLVDSACTQLFVCNSCNVLICQ